LVACASFGRFTPTPGASKTHNFPRSYFSYMLQTWKVASGIYIYTHTHTQVAVLSCPVPLHAGC